ncbi:hypothetical protein E4U19_005962 [Claviceps sp. Clav32 group G5]|nr:hypothetical protein E4U19_005962 [Claviceps sp. Clav32 group G5]
MGRASEPLPEQAFEPLQTFGSSEDAIESVGIASSNDLSLGPYDHLIVKGKGRPKGSLGLGSRSHRRDPTLLDRALNQERNEALQNSSSAPSSSAPPALQPAPSVRNRKRRLPHPEFAVPDAPNSPPTTTSASATIKALEWLKVHGDTYEAGTQMPRASQRMAPPLEDPEAPFSLGDPGDITLRDSEGLAIEVEDDVSHVTVNNSFFFLRGRVRCVCGECGLYSVEPRHAHQSTRVSHLLEYPTIFRVATVTRCNRY